MLPLPAHYYQKASSMMITPITIILFSQGIPLCGPFIFLVVSLNDIHFWQQSLHHFSCTKPLQEGGLFLPHPDILTPKLGRQSRYINEFLPAEQEGEQECDLN